MTEIALGSAGGRKVSIDLDVLLRTRLLIQANSGGGKSFLLRRLGEQLFGRVPVVIVDPEGEFATLRERYGYVLVGKGGETPADTRSAALVAHKLLELNASAVCDLFEMKPMERHAWVRLFLEALMNAPKRLWHPVVIVVDEAHRFAPERGQGESEASEAMIALATDGRKRGFCPAWATQRLSKVRKDATAELLNRLVGPTFEDLDLDRAADLLSILRPERPAFFTEMKRLDPGRFWAFGRAIALERVLVTIGPVTTTHPEPGSAKHAAEPPPAPEKVRALLPKLADLPQQAEAKAKTEADLRADVRRLTAELAEERRGAGNKIAGPPPKPVEVVKPADVKALTAAARDLLRGADDARARADRLYEIATRAAQAGQEVVRALDRVASHSQAPARPAVAPPRAVALPPRVSASPGDPDVGKGAVRRILVALAQHPEGLTARRIGVFAGVSAGGGSFSTWMSRARQAGWLATGADEVHRITGEGLAALGTYDPLPTGPELVAYWLREIGDGGAGRIFKAIIDAYPEPLSMQEIGERAQVSAAGGSFSTWMSRLRTRDLIVDVARGQVRLSEELGGATS